MKLSELISTEFYFQLIRDTEFDQLGMITSKFDKKGVLSFLTDEKFVDHLFQNKKINGVITKAEIYDKYTEHFSDLGVLLSDNPKKLFYEIHNFLTDDGFYSKPFENEISNSAEISKNAIIGPHSIIIGNNSIIEDNVIINPGTTVGNDVIVRSGTILGSNGFQFLNDDGVVLQVRSSGKVIIKDNVEIQHNCSIDKGVLGGNTILNEYVKLDNFVHIAHDCQIGDRTLITAGVKFGGRTVVGKDCWLGINATISNGLVIGDNVKVTLGSVVTKNIDDNSVVSGNFAIDHKKFIQFIKSIR